MSCTSPSSLIPIGTPYDMVLGKGGTAPTEISWYNQRCQRSFLPETQMNLRSTHASEALSLREEGTLAMLNVSGNYGQNCI